MATVASGRMTRVKAGRLTEQEHDQGEDHLEREGGDSA
jgi:hypothetical protein